jgi:lipid-A-disaccharide synthase
VVCYRANALTVAFAKRFAKVEYISLVNLIANKPVVRELIQEDLNKNTLETEFSKITKDKNNRMTMVAEYENIEKMLGSQGVSDKAVLSILKTLKGTK